jgi:hypothetical protein
MVLLKKITGLIFYFSFVLFASCTTLPSKVVKQDKDVAYNLLDVSVVKSGNVLNVQFIIEKKYQEILSDKNCTDIQTFLGEMFYELKTDPPEIWIIPWLPIGFSIGAVADVLSLGQHNRVDCKYVEKTNTRKRLVDKGMGQFYGRFKVVNVEDGSVITDKTLNGLSVSQFRFDIGNEYKSILVHVDGNLEVADNSFRVDEQTIPSGN